MVGIGAVKYADLKQNRLSDYRFDWEKLISLKGHAGPYVQYAFARICSIFRKAGIDMADVPGGPVKFATEHELALAKVLIRLSDVLFQAAQSYQPHLIAEHAYQLARSFSAFYEHCPILQGEADTRESRLRLSAFAARQLRRSLHLLGIGVLERM